MSDTDREFRAITADIMSEEANDLLEKHIARSRKWLAEQQAAGEPADLRDFIKRLHGEPSQKGPIVAAYAAALWRLLEREPKPVAQCSAGHRHYRSFVCTKAMGHGGEHGYAGCFWPDSEATNRPIRDADTCGIGDE